MKRERRLKLKKRVFTAILIVIPLLFFVILESGLRFFRYGPDIRLFVTEENSGRVLHVMNPDVKARYFSQVSFTPNTSLDYFLVPKPSGTYRIFCLGGSTTIGFPYGQVGSFSTFLRQRLEAIVPEKKIEVINLGMTATNSYTVLDLAREVSDYEPDLLLVYDGHNEFYGALGSASHESFGGTRWSANLHLALIKLKTYLLLRNTLQSVASLFGPSVPESSQGTLMERMARGSYIPYNSPLYTSTLHSFQSNLEDLKILAAQINVPVLLGTQVSNLTGLPPFVSILHPTVPREQQSRFHQLLSEAESLISARSYDRAYIVLGQAMEIDSMYAALRYIRGKCFKGAGDNRRALAEFRSARDFDQLRFRASSDFNMAILHASGSHVFVCDLEQIFLSASKDSLLGNNLVLEHLHPNLRGYFLMAKGYAESMRAKSLLVTEHLWKRADTLDEDRLWNGRLVTPIDQIAADRRIQFLTSSWPFKESTEAVPDVPQSDSVANIAEMLTRGEITWEQAHVLAGEYYTSRSDFSSAAREYRTLHEMFPYNVSPALRLGETYLAQNNYTKATEVFRRSLDIETTAFALVRLGTILLDTHHAMESLPLLERAYSLSVNSHDRLQSGYYLGLAYIQTGQPSRAKVPLESTLQVDPGFRPALQLLKRMKQ